MHTRMLLTQGVLVLVCWGVALAQPVRLPVTVAKFLTPKAVTDPAEFFHLWRSLGGPPLKLQQVLTVKPALAHAGMPAIKAMLNSLKLNAIDGLDPNPANLVTAACMGVVAAAAPGGGGGGGGELVCICRLESDANNAAQFRLTVATSNQIASSCIRELVLHHLTT